MHFDKAMIDLVKEVRRRAPSDLKPAVKLANPELFNELLNYYHTNKDTVTNALIKALFEHAGEPWIQALQTNTQPEQKHNTHVYRGQISQVSVTNPSDQTETIKKKATQRIYRGQVIYS